MSAISQALAATERWDEARAAANAIPDDIGGSKADTLSALSQALAAAERWDEARATADAISEEVFGRRATALCTLATALAKADLLPQAVTLLTDIWRRAQARDGLLRLFVVPPELLRTYPGLGKAFLDSFAWVDGQLAIG